ncbi:protein EXECUTER 1, chloroplastic-like isoform X1 [Vicia villosa]|uniref:protein EXECUTER 1, chloroplastic-like isoform X1 n=1 Tax=Vicia villosa TaxID=3911 RepID=UPI00273C8566|nr:protein EXECUTER 1, chloroplastic-like isoform X1 [Vicia villosa]XP_058759218.1 protein EXECUTER 1, chloroplastic-like isoform X1 [Vicia villosa]XP_058759219.1 protein EXECUTER 1, chloroplastic-like isoform X1 [Vicia villosa]
MASISSISPPNLTFPKQNLAVPFPLQRPSLLHFPSQPLCLCLNSVADDSHSNTNNNDRRWDSMLQEFVTGAMKQFESYVNAFSKGRAADEDQDDVSDEGWDWNRWRQHFDEVDDQERIVIILKSQLRHAVYVEDYEEASRLQVAIAAASNNDSVGKVISLLKRAIREERYSDAAYLRDKAGAGLVGWWAGISKDVNDLPGLIIRITPEHGRYVARSYSPRQLATSAAGVPLFEFFLTMDKKGDFKSQAVYLKRKGSYQGPPTMSSKTSEASELFVVSTEDSESGDDRSDGSDPSERMPAFQNVLKDMIPGEKVKIFTPGKVDKDLISNAIEESNVEEESGDENEDREDDGDEEDVDVDVDIDVDEYEDDNEDEDEDEEEDEDEDGDEDEEKKNDAVTRELENFISETDQEGDDENEINADLETFEREEQNEIAVKFVIGDLMQKLSSNLSPRDLLRVPAKLEINERRSFSFTVENEVNQQDGYDKGKSSSDKSSEFQSRHRVKFIGKENVPAKVLKEVGEFISLTLSQAQNHQPLSGSTIFNRIEIPTSFDPLNGLYIGTYGLYSSEVIQMRHRYGQWQEDDRAKETSDLEFYEYVEALKLTGDPYVPAGQVAFRAKVGKMYQLPHKGIIPEEFGVIARYKGEGRLAEPGFQNPRWVDGELVILDGKHIKAGPVVGFVYWAPEYHFLVFFNRLRLQQ